MILEHQVAEIDYVESILKTNVNYRFLNQMFDNIERVNLNTTSVIIKNSIFADEDIYFYNNAADEPLIIDGENINKNRQIQLICTFLAKLSLQNISDSTRIMLFSKILSDRLFTRNFTIETRELIFLKMSENLKDITIAEENDSFEVAIFYVLKEGEYLDLVNYFDLLKSKRYWFKQTRYVTNNDLSKSTSWKVTEPLRRMHQSLLKLQAKMNGFLIKGIAGILPKKEIWLVGEREFQAQDNGYHFFKYVREKYPEKNLYYIINEKSNDFDVVNQYGNVIKQHSFKHKLYIHRANKLISGWTFEECSLPSSKNKYKIEYYRELVRSKKNICLQHGVITRNIGPYLRKEIFEQDAIMCSSKVEQKIIMNTLGYTEEEVKVTGLPRHDYFKKVSFELKNQILIMPTWRRDLANVSDAIFVKSDYYKQYSGLLSNQEFNDFITENNITVKFYVHFQLQRYLKYFKTENPLISFTSSDKVSDLLLESKLLITDFSSVASDFLYLKKPVILFTFDEFFFHHVKTKYLEPTSVGSPVKDVTEVIPLLRSIHNRDYSLTEKQIKARENIFAYDDTQNIERVLAAIEQV